MYECNTCNFSTDRFTDLNRHYNTKKHIKNEYLNSLKCDDTLDHTISKRQKSVEILTNKEKIYHQTDNFVENNLKKLEFFDNNANNLTINTSADSQCEKTYNCVHCEKTFNSRQALWAHKKVCDGIKIPKLNAKELEIKQLKLELTEMNKLKLEVNVMKDLICKLTNNNIINTNSNNTYNSTNTDNSINTHNNQKIVNVFNYVSSNYTNTPTIKRLELQDIDNLLEDKNSKHTIEELLVYYQSKCVLDEFLGDIIKTAYKKEDPEEQQFWTSNIQKLTFIVRQLLNKKDKVWLQDRNGTCLVNHIIDPILKVIKKSLQLYVESVDKGKYNCSKTIDEFEKFMKNGVHASDIIVDIDKKILHHKILKYIAPHFQLEQTNLLKNVAEKTPTKKVQIKHIEMPSNDKKSIEQEKKPKKKQTKPTGKLLTK